jgi:hypothetical protein
MRVFLMTGALALALAGCGKSETERKVVMTDAAGNSTTATVKSDGEATTIKSEDGTLTVNTGGDKTAFPSFAPQYPGSKVTSVMTASGEQGKSGQVIGMETSDDPARVLAFYEEKLKAANMPVKMKTTTPEGGMIAAGNEGDQGAMITVGRSGDMTNIGIIAGGEAQ